VLALLTDFVTDEIAQYGLLAIFVLMVLESACIPIPSEVTMLFGGALTTASFLAPEQQLDFWLVVLAGTVGNVVGSWLAYWAGYTGGRPLVDRWGRYLLIRPHEVDRAHDWFERKGQSAVFIGRLLPVIRTFISLPAGVVRMGFWRFTFYTVLGCLPWCLALTWIGARLGERWEEAERLMRPFAWAIAVVLAAGIMWWVWHRIRTIRAEEAERREQAAMAEGSEEG
jgi:membrane protein DedA with SNARE-associated domain